MIAAHGRGFAATEAITLTLGTAALTATVTDAHGAFDLRLLVPTLPTGAYSLTAAGPAAAPAASTTFTVLPAPVPHLAVSRLAAAPGRTITVAGSHFGSSETVQLSLASSVVATATTTAGGYFKTHFIVPPLAPGATTFTALGTTSGISLSVAFTVQAPPPPAFGLSRRVAVSGQSVVAQGSHFGPSELVNLTMPTGSGIVLTVATVSTTVGGAFKTSFSVPVAPLGLYYVTALGASSAISASFPLRIVAPPSPALLLSRHKGVAGTIVLARGYHFRAGEIATLSMGNMQVATATVSASGTFYARFAAPSLATGTYTVIAKGGTSGISASSFFVVNPAPFGTVTGIVGDGASTPLADAVVHAVQPGSGRSASTTTGAGGSYHLTLHTGYWRLEAIMRDGIHLRLAPVGVFVGAAAVVTQNLMAPRAPALLEGTIFGPPSTTITVTAHSLRDASQVAVVTDSTGRASYTLGATIGLWRINAALPPIAAMSSTRRTAAPWP